METQEFGKHGLRREFSSVAEFVDHATAGANPLGPGASSLATGKQYAKWNGTRNMDEAVTLAHAWHDGAARIERLALSLAPSVTRPRFRTEFAPTLPGALAIGDYLAGSPVPYVTRREIARVSAGSKIFRVSVNCTPSAMVDPEIYERRGAAIVALVNAMEKSGRRCAVDIEWITGHSRAIAEENLHYVINAKRPEQRVSLPALAFALAHPSFPRRFVFATMERESADRRRRFHVPGGYGPITTDGIENEGYHLRFGPMFGTDKQWKSEESAAIWVRTEAEKYGVKFK